MTIAGPSVAVTAVALVQGQGLNKAHTGASWNTSIHGSPRRRVSRGPAAIAVIAVL